MSTLRFIDPPEATGLTFLYQPIISATTGRVVAAEALARTLQPSGDLGSAQHVFEDARRTGDSEAIDRFAVSAALRQGGAWRMRGVPMPIHVNVSASTLSHAGAESFAAWIESLAIDPSVLTLEITESVQCDDVERLAHVATRLRNAGVEVAVDDFGCGYSTMALLQELRADVLKIDRRFIEPLTGDGRTRVLVRHFIEMAHDLGMRAIAEGVETDAQAAWLVRHGCDELQGFAIARPLGHETFLAWSIDRRAHPHVPAAC